MKSCKCRNKWFQNILFVIFRGNIWLITGLIISIIHVQMLFINNNLNLNCKKCKIQTYKKYRVIIIIMGSLCITLWHVHYQLILNYVRSIIRAISCFNKHVSPCINYCSQLQPLLISQWCCYTAQYIFLIVPMHHVGPSLCASVTTGIPVINSGKLARISEHQCRNWPIIGSSGPDIWAHLWNSVLKQ